jgi:hypothetical protein
MRTSFVVKSILAAAAALAPLASQAESNIITGNGANLTATAHVDFVITIPKYVFLRVGTGTAYTNIASLANNTTVDLITFTLTPAQVGNGTAVAATGGDVAGNSGTETAALLSNAGSVTLNCSTVAALSDGAAGDTISFAQIKTTVATLTSATALPAPPLGDGACTGPVTVSPPAGSKIINRDATWTYSYLNTAVVPGGIYGGAGGTNNGRVTYTAVLP